MAKKDKTQQNEVFNKLFCTITEDDILQLKKNKFWIGKTVLPDKDVETLLAEARAMQGMFLWKLLLNDVKWVSNQRMFELSKNWEDMIFGKACLYIIDILEKKVNKLSQIEYGKKSKEGEESKKKLKEHSL